MAKRIESPITQSVEADVIRIVTATPDQTVSAITKLVKVDGFDVLGKKEKRQMVQNTSDRLFRKGIFEIVKGTKKTGREVSVYRLAKK